MRRTILWVACLIFFGCRCSSAFSVLNRQSRSTRLVRGCQSRIHLQDFTSCKLAASSSPLFSDSSREPWFSVRCVANSCLEIVRQHWKQIRDLRQRRTSVRRRVVILTAGLMFWWSSTAGVLMAPPVAHAVSRTTVTERLLEKTSPDLDTIIDRYVQQHMFDDDLSVTDPIGSTYREAYHDAVTGRHPADLREITADVLQGSKLVGQHQQNDRISLGDSIGSLLTGAVSFLQKRVGVSETVATMVLAAAFVVAGPSIFLFAGMMVGGISKRNMDKTFKKRYGDTYSVDATIKQEPVVEAPPDEEDDEGDDEDNNDDEDDDEDDDVDNGKK